MDVHPKKKSVIATIVLSGTGLGFAPSFTHQSHPKLAPWSEPSGRCANRRPLEASSRTASGADLHLHPLLVEPSPSYESLIRLQDAIFSGPENKNHWDHIPQSKLQRFQTSSLWGSRLLVPIPRSQVSQQSARSFGMRNPLTGCMKVQASVSYCLPGPGMRSTNNKSPGFDCATMGLPYSDGEFRSAQSWDIARPCLTGISSCRSLQRPWLMTHWWPNKCSLSLGPSSCTRSVILLQTSIYCLW